MSVVITKRGKFVEFGQGFLLFNEFSGWEDCKGKLQKEWGLFQPNLLRFLQWSVAEGENAKLLWSFAGNMSLKSVF